jgi:hypothetical protein
MFEHIIFKVIQDPFSFTCVEENQGMERLAMVITKIIHVVTPMPVPCRHEIDDVSN